MPAPRQHQRGHPLQLMVLSISMASLTDLIVLRRPGHC